MLHKFNTFDQVDVPCCGVYRGIIMGEHVIEGELYYFVQYTYNKRVTGDWFAERIIERV